VRLLFGDQPERGGVRDIRRQLRRIVVVRGGIGRQIRDVLLRVLDRLASARLELVQGLLG
jgi:hypothetical protein